MIVVVSLRHPFRYLTQSLFKVIVVVSLRHPFRYLTQSLSKVIVVVSLRHPFRGLSSKPFKTSHSVLLAFLILANLLKHSLRSLWSKCCLCFEASFNQIHLLSHPLRGMLVALLALKKPLTFVTGFVIRIGFEPMALILEG